MNQVYLPAIKNIPNLDDTQIESNLSTSSKTLSKLYHQKGFKVYQMHFAKHRIIASFIHIRKYKQSAG